MEEIRFARLSVSDGLYSDVERLLNEAFIEDERRYEVDERNLVTTNPLFSMNALMSGNDWVGLLSSWNFGLLTYIEHFAISPQMRNKGLGRKFLAEYLKQTGRPAVIEVEPRNAADNASRRIAFYEAIGFREWSTPYVQPSYGKGKKKIPMTLMAYALEEEQFASKVISLLETKVYKVSKVS